MLLTIVVPLFNAQDFVIESLDSIVYQLVEDTEIIIVNDASTDQSFGLVANYLEGLSPYFRQKIKLINLLENKGVGYARHLAINSARGHYIASLDPDDIVSVDYIEKIISVISGKEIDILQFNISRFFKDIDDSYIMTSFFLNSGLHELNQNIRKDFYEQCFWSFCSRVVRKSLIANIDFCILRNCEDVYALPLAISRSNNIYLLNDNIYYYRLNPTSLSKSKKHNKNVIFSYSFIFRRYFDHIKDDDNLKFALFAIIRSYIKFNYDVYGYKKAKIEWNSLKTRVNKWDSFKLNKLTHRLFYVFGVNFLVLMNLFNK